MHLEPRIRLQEIVGPTMTDEKSVVMNMMRKQQQKGLRAEEGISAQPQRAQQRLPLPLLRQLSSRLQHQETQR